MYTKIFIAGAAATWFSAVNAANCIKVDYGNGFQKFSVSAQIPNDGDQPGICGGLWDNLNAFSQCYNNVASPSCGGNNNQLEWDLTVPDACDGGCIESAWYEQTKNAYGSISC